MKLEAKNLFKIYGKRTVVNNVSLEVNQGEIVGLLGPNGAGKTTSFYMIVGFVKPLQGQIFLDNKDLTSYPMYKRGAMGIGYLPQEVTVSDGVTVREYIEQTIGDLNSIRDRLRDLEAQMADTDDLDAVI